jgi:hypothetical protein
MQQETLALAEARPTQATLQRSSHQPKVSEVVLSQVTFSPTPLEVEVVQAASGLMARRPTRKGVLAETVVPEELFGSQALPLTASLLVEVVVECMRALTTQYCLTTLTPVVQGVRAVGTVPHLLTLARRQPPTHQLLPSQGSPTQDLVVVVRELLAMLLTLPPEALAVQVL